MAKKQRRKSVRSQRTPGGPPPPPAAAGLGPAEAAEALRVAEAALDAGDLATLRKVAVVRGLVHGGVRARAWQRLLGVSLRAFDRARYYADSRGSHQDASVVEVDVERSLWAFTRGWSDEDRAVRRAALQRVLNAAVVAAAGRRRYYQGLHDVASVLLLVAGEFPAYVMLARLMEHQLRDCTASSLGPVVSSLEMVLPLVRAADPELAGFLARSGVPPHFALSWRLTWFAHDAGSLEEAARLFDLLVASHPYMPFYVGVAAMVSHRAEILRLECDAPYVHKFLIDMPVFAEAPAGGGLAIRALALFRAHPPRALAARLGREKALAAADLPSVAAFLSDAGAWEVPAEVPGGTAAPGGAGGAWPRAAAALPAQVLLGAAATSLAVFAGAFLRPLWAATAEGEFPA